MRWWDPNTYSATWEDALGILRSPFITVLVREISLKNEAEVLEVGCGSGKFSVAFAMRGDSVTCTDSNADMIKKARQNFPNMKIFYSIAELPFVHNRYTGGTPAMGSGQFDLVFNEGTIEHFLDRSNRISSIQDMMLCAKKDGWVCVNVPFYLVRGKCPEDEHPYRSEEELKEELRKAGLINVKTWGLKVVTEQGSGRQFLVGIGRRP